MSGHRIVPAGDSALIVELEARVAPEVNARAIALADGIEREKLPGVRDVVTTYCAVTVYFDPLRTDLARLMNALDRHAAMSQAAQIKTAPAINVPVCYGGEFGPDLGAVARFAGCSEEEVIRIHAATVYRVYMLGFVPGFAYMGTVDPRLAVPRHSTPRLKVAAGSVGIAGSQTGIYPIETPGGWHLIGRTPVKPFDASRRHPFLFKPGDALAFVPIEASTFGSMLEGS